MSTIPRSLFGFDNSFVRELEGLYEPWQPAGSSRPTFLALNRPLAAELGLDVATLERPEGLDVLAGNRVPEGATPVAQAYAGHQFGSFVPRLGDGRALLLGELAAPDGRRVDVHFKGSGRTPFARGGDGKAAVGPMLREYVISEAMHALGVPTTRSLAVVGTGDHVLRETKLPGAILTRVAASHLRVGTFQYAAQAGDTGLVRRLTEYAIDRHYPEVADEEHPYLAFFTAVVDAQAALIARWMLVGFVHGVMNTDNMTISGETIDYGPCAFMEAFAPGTVFSSIDHAGRYAYGNQPYLAQWDLARLAEPLVPLVDEDSDVAVAALTTVLSTFPARYSGYWLEGMRAKLGLPTAVGGPPAEDDAEAVAPDVALANDLMALFQADGVDFTLGFRRLAGALTGEDRWLRDQFTDCEAFDGWAARWRALLGDHDPQQVAAAMNRVNPLYIPRNERVEQALTAATEGDMAPFERLVEVVRAPFDEQADAELYATPAAPAGEPYRTFCGT
ncbi:MAG: YdiU family protein [Patulibacter sp.]|nr:YdiU family protein [Patulibacter sp.]